MSLEQAIRSRAYALGFQACRFTTALPPATGARFQQWLLEQKHGEMAWLARQVARRLEPRLVLPGAQSIVLVVVAYEGPGSAPPGAVSRPEAKGQDGPPAASSGLLASYACHTDYHDLLGPRLQSLSELVNQLGGPATRSLCYTDTGPLLERDLAQRAGLGFVGKHTNLISRDHGNWLLLGEILTTLRLQPDPPEKNRCGTCARCLAACPTQAITAPFQLDARRCISYLTIELKGAIPEALRPSIGRRVFGCDDCLAVCPWNRFARAGALMSAQRRADLEQPDLLELLGLDQAAFKARFAGTPVLRSKRRGLLRNVCVALGNVGDGAAVPALSQAASDPEPLIAEHARWAVVRIQQRHGCGNTTTRWR
jgi:epoxyqueuosine reductase